MGQVLRITFNNTDYTFQILNATPLSTENHEIQILLNGVTVTIIKDKSGWKPKNDFNHQDFGLAAAIGKVLSLRYRI